MKKIPVQSAKPSGTSPSSRKGAPAGKKIPAAAKRSKPGSAKPGSSGKKPPILPGVPLSKPRVVLTGFLAKQRNRLLMLKDTLLDSMNGVAKDSLRSRADGSEASAFGMHQADAGSDAYDRDFALSLLSQEQDSLYEIDEALKRVESGSYGICEISSKAIPHIRLEALPFTRYTVECQAEIEKRARFSRVRQPITSLFGLGDDEGTESDDDDSSNDSKD
ncbi:MAG: TraR/DksA C4-type zinc finger protein [Verrucomicrobiae bacterium]